jgi:hypothetical protein
MPIRSYQIAAAGFNERDHTSADRPSTALAPAWRQTMPLSLAIASGFPFFCGKS